MNKLLYASWALIFLVIVLSVLTSPKNNGAVSHKNSNTQVTQKNSASETSLSDLLSKPKDFLGKKVSVRGKVVYEVICPPGQSSQKTNCISTAYLVDSQTPGTNIAAYDRNKGLILYENSFQVNCATQKTLPQNCSGWINGHQYLVTGLFDYETFQGKKLERLAMDALARQEL